ncbi:MAG TPA: CapA family protein, partial [Candidatus Obscuribacterales bacterium]
MPLAVAPLRVVSPAPAETGDHPLAHLLNQALALSPPLQVRGLPPQIEVYLPAAHVYAVAAILAQVEHQVRSLSGSTYWEVAVYLEPPGDGAARLIYHRLIEREAASPSGGVPWQAASYAAPEPASPPRSPTLGTSRRWGLGAIAVGVRGLAVGMGLDWQQGGARRAATATFIPLAQDDGLGRSLRLPALPITLGEPLPAPPDPRQELPLMPQVAAPLERLTTAAEEVAAVKLKAVGDIILGTNFPDYRLPADPLAVFSGVQMFMGEVDVLFGNFESTLTDHPTSAKDISQGMTFAFRTPPAFAGALQAAGFDVLSVANNHAFDFGDVGFADTIAHIEQAGMQAVGRKDDIVMVEANGYAIAFIGFSYWSDHNDMNDLATATRLVQTAQTQADMVVISVHAGAEGSDATAVRNQTEIFLSENRGNLVQFSHAMIDAGADLVLGHGPHVPRAIELYQNKLIAYSLGNFVGYRTLSTVGPLGQSLILHVELNPNGDFLRGRVIPVALDANGVPYLDDLFGSVTLVRQLT